MQWRTSDWHGCVAGRPAAAEGRSPTADTLPPPLQPPPQVLYPTLTDYDIRYYVMEVLKVRGCTASVLHVYCPWL